MKITNRQGVSAALIFVWLFLFSNGGFSQTIPFDSDGWEIDAKESKVIEHSGRQSLLLKGGMAIVKDPNFTDGTIEFN